MMTQEKLQQASTDLLTAADRGDAEALAAVGWDLLTEADVERAEIARLRAQLHEAHGYPADEMVRELAAELETAQVEAARLRAQLHAVAQGRAPKAA